MTLPTTQLPTSLGISARGPLSDVLLRLLEGQETVPRHELPQRARDAATASDPIGDDDLQLSLFLLYAIAYGSLDQRGAEWEWDPDVVVARGTLERAFEAALREQVEVPAIPAAEREAVAAALFELTAPTPGPSLSRYIARTADREQVLELLMHRSIYTLREADAHSWTIARLTGRAKAALMEIQADEYGGGSFERMHQELYARTMRGAGLDDTYGAYVDVVPAITLASFNLMTMFGRTRRRRGRGDPPHPPHGRALPVRRLAHQALLRRQPQDGGLPHRVT